MPLTDRETEAPFGAGHQPKAQLECLLKVAELLQSEMDKRLERHAHSFYFFVTLLGGVIVGIATALAGSIDPYELSVVLTFLPWLTTPLAAMFFDDEILRAGTDLYIRDCVANRVEALLRPTEDGRAGFFQYSLTSRFNFIRKLPGSPCPNPRRAANLRPLLFYTPFFIASDFLFQTFPQWRDFHLVPFHLLRVLLAASSLLGALGCLGLVVDVAIAIALSFQWRKCWRLWKLVTQC